MAGITASRHINRLAESVRELCADRVFEEKWVIAPSLRTGFQWLDAVVRSGRPVLNARIKTLTGMALELAAPEMERRGSSLLRGIRAELLVDGVLARMREEGSYLSRLEASPGLVRAASATLRDLRLGGLASKDLSPRLFEVEAKGRELISLLSAYEEELVSRCLTDFAGVLRLAARRLETDASAMPPGCLVAVPGDMVEEMRGLERVLWDAVPQERRILLATDRPCEERAGGSSDSALLAWISRPGEAPPPLNDDSMKIFRAVGEVNEVREVLRRCSGAGIPFDEVEILHTDTLTYVPLIYEICSLLASEPGEVVPATFAEGIPVLYSRPGRALAAWISWTEEGFPQSTLARMVQDGLLDLGTSMPEGWSFSRLGTILRALPIGKGRERYLPAIDAELESLEWKMSQPAFEEDGEEKERYLEGLGRRMKMLGALRELIGGLLEGIPEPEQDGLWLLFGAEAFLLERVRAISEIDEYGRQRLLDDIGELSSCLQEVDTPISILDIRGWLAEMARSARVEGKGPRPGCLYVAPLAGGGHSGRPYTFILGLDDGRFPGAGLQDPLLLDSEREAISGDLPTAAERLSASLEGFARLAARIRGMVTLSYCCRSLSDDRDMFPSPVLLAAYRIISGDREGVQDDLLACLDEPVSFAPQDPVHCLDTAEWWLCRLCTDPAPQDPEGIVAHAFPHLGRGLEARRARESDRFTEYDGYVPEVGEDLDAAKPGGPVLSARRLETLGCCPLEYFFAYVLRIKPPEEHLLDPSRWLEPIEKGSLLHAVFRRFHLRVREEDRRPALDRDWGLLQNILGEEMEEWSHRKPPPSGEVYERERDDLRRAARIFLREEEEHCRERRPLYFEVAIGLDAEKEGNPVDSPDPVEIRLPDGRIVRTRGYIDRIDELGEPGSLRFSVCDYKTGSTYGYRREDPFRQGRRVQNLIYLAQAESRLAACHPGARVESFQYFFPSTHAHGERIEWSREELDGGRRILALLCEMLSLGCFPFTDKDEDVRYSNYRAAFGDIPRAEEETRRKMANPENLALSPFRDLRDTGKRGR